jgi:hypothetical protein
MDNGGQHCKPGRKQEYGFPDEFFPSSLVDPTPGAIRKSSG